MRSRVRILSSRYVKGTFIGKMNVPFFFFTIQACGNQVTLHSDNEQAV
jgi:hypothetical protein